MTAVVIVVGWAPCATVVGTVGILTVEGSAVVVGRMGSATADDVVEMMIGVVDVKVEEADVVVGAGSS